MAGLPPLKDVMQDKTGDVGEQKNQRICLRLSSTICGKGLPLQHGVCHCGVGNVCAIGKDPLILGTGVRPRILASNISTSGVCADSPATFYHAAEQTLFSERVLHGARAIEWILVGEDD